MPVHKEDANRALELLEKYHEKLTKPQDRALRGAIERVIRIFQSRLFLALLDIQEFYEATLLDGSKSPQQKAYETLEVAEKWETRPVDSDQGGVNFYSNDKVISAQREERAAETQAYPVSYPSQVPVQEYGMEAD